MNQYVKELHELKPCPWCGDTSYSNIIRHAANDLFVIDHMDSVFHLRSSVVFKSKEEAENVWNNQLAWDEKVMGAT